MRHLGCFHGDLEVVAKELGEYVKASDTIVSTQKHAKEVEFHRGDGYLRLVCKGMPFDLFLNILRDVAPLPFFLTLPVLGVFILYKSVEREDCCSDFEDRLIQRIHNLELTDDALRVLNPLCWEAAESHSQITAERPRLLVVIREHLLLEKLNILNCLLHLGIKSDEMIFVAKNDRSLYRDRVASYIRGRGIKLLFSMEDAIEILNGHEEFINLVTLDDGGELIIRMYEEGFASRWYCRFIETTTKGVVRIKDKGLDISFRDLSTTEIKASLSEGIAASCVFRLRHLMKHSKLAGVQCLVGGFGRIGSELARILSALGTEVSICDPLGDRRAEASKAFAVYESAADAFMGGRFAIYIGCAGTPSIRLSDLISASNIVYAAAASSNDLRLLLDDLESTASTKIRIERYGDLYTLEDGKKIIVLGHGDAINLFYDEGVSEPEFDIFNLLSFNSIVEEIENLVTIDTDVALRASGSSRAFN